MTEMRTRHQYMIATGKRISRGAWERMNTAHAVHSALDSMGRPTHRVVDFIRHEDGTPKLDKDGKRQPLVQQNFTHVLLPNTAKHNRKVKQLDRWNPKSKRSRYKEGQEAGRTR